MVRVYYGCLVPDLENLHRPAACVKRVASFRAVRYGRKVYFNYCIDVVAAVSVFGHDCYVLLLVQLHAYHGVVEAFYHLARSRLELQRRPPYGRVEYAAVFELSRIVDGYVVSFIS